MPFVLDASTAACWALRDEESPIATEALNRIVDDGALVPAVWWFELRNTLVVAERRSRMTALDTASFLKGIRRFEISIDRDPDEDSILVLARRHRLTVYDAAYLELAIRENVSISTLDAALARAARAEGIRIIGGAA